MDIGLIYADCYLFILLYPDIIQFNVCYLLVLLFILTHDLVNRSLTYSVAINTKYTMYTNKWKMSFML